DIEQEPPVIRVLTFKRVVFGVTCSPYLLNATLNVHLEKFKESHALLVKQLKESLYVDDVVCGARTEESAFEFYLESKMLFKEGGFNLRKFVTNSESLRVKIKEHEKSSTSNEQDMSDTDTTLRKDQSDTEREREHKVLGVLWDPMRDEIIVGFGEIALEAHSVNPTKRSIVSIVGKFYDPLGILSPVTIRFKILFQELCREKRDWDEPITGPLLTRWHMLINDLKASESVRIKRCVSEQQGMCELIGFCDAAVVYLKDGNGVVRVIAAKTRVAPLKTQSVPRLELLAALLLSRLIENVLESASM
uniref:Reverse transcriptase domain-containing protein n=1 Tax=Amphimedon queenslandica TaxID=400682 RepID=A0A1X7SND0_AMPQE